MILCIERNAIACSLSQRPPGGACARPLQQVGGASTIACLSNLYAVHNVHRPIMSKQVQSILQMFFTYNRKCCSQCVKAVDIVMLT